MSELFNKALWIPDQALITGSNLSRYMQWLTEQNIVTVNDYDALYAWSVSDPASFWSSISRYFRICFHHVSGQVLRLPATGMIGVKWFEGSTLSYAEHVFRNRDDERPAIIFSSESGESAEISWQLLEVQVAAVAAWMRSRGVGMGDRVVSLLPNIPETVVAFLAANSLGAIWCSCSPDFGVDAIRDRIGQVEPKLLILSDGYHYGGKVFDRSAEWDRLLDDLPSIRDIVMVDLISSSFRLHGTVSWADILIHTAGTLCFEAVPFDHPIWIL